MGSCISSNYSISPAEYIQNMETCKSDKCKSETNDKTKCIGAVNLLNNESNTELNTDSNTELNNIYHYGMVNPSKNWNTYSDNTNMDTQKNKDEMGGYLCFSYRHGDKIEPSCVSRMFRTQDFYFCHAISAEELKHNHILHSLNYRLHKCIGDFDTLSFALTQPRIYKIQNYKKCMFYIYNDLIKIFSQETGLIHCVNDSIARDKFLAIIRKIDSAPQKYKFELINFNL